MAGIPLGDLAAEHGTPLFVFDEDTIRRQCRMMERILSRYTDGPVQICYAVKANSDARILQIIAQEGLGADVASGGELAAALDAGFDPSQIVLNGNTKTDAELRRAVAMGIQAVIVDSEDELDHLNALTTDAETRVLSAGS